MGGEGVRGGDVRERGREEAKEEGGKERGRGGSLGRRKEDTCRLY